MLYRPARKATAPSELKGQEPSSSSLSNQFNKQLHPIDEAGSIWWIINKVRPLNPATYAPDDLVVPQVPLRIGRGDSEMRLRQEAATALESMVEAASKDMVNLMLSSGYRSYQLQVAVYNASVQKYGQAGADKQSARPGTSENQTGLAADLEPVTRECELEVCFSNLPEGQWLAANSYKYGFVIRYPVGKESITGYSYQPWHVRYVGIELATELLKQNVKTLEEFFGVIPTRQPY